MKKLGIFALLLLAGCGTTFHRDWESSPKAAAGLEGCWDGTWTSDGNGHAGNLRCIITRREDSGYDARYYATFGWCIFGFSFEYTIPTTAVAQGEAWLLRGSAMLDYWIAGGLYEYEARVDHDEYVATYRASFDHGIFRMKRVR